MIKAIFFDIDGTILNGNKGIPESTLLALAKLKERGIETSSNQENQYQEMV